MVPLSSKELEERLRAAGNTLLQPPSSVDELLILLDKVEKLLLKVEQAPANSMRGAISPLLKALVAEELLKHSDVDVNVGVSSCFSEITRITAPDAPYTDGLMKEIFQLILSTFEHLSDTSSRSHVKRTSILETMSTVRSCVIMLDLECDQMIVEMFQNFLKVIRDYHAQVIFASMETIMTLVIQESEEISPHLLNPILTTLNKNNEAVLPIAKRLALGVIQRCSDKIRPYIAQAVKALDVSLDDYEQAVVSLCYEKNSTSGHINENVVTDQLVDKGDAQETNPQEICNEDIHGSPSEVPPVEADKSLDKLREGSIQLSLSKAPEDEDVNAASPPKSGILPEGNQSKKSGRKKMIMKETVSFDTVSNKASERENIPKAQTRLRGNRRYETNNKGKTSTEVVSKNDGGNTSDSETKSLEQTENLGDASNKSDAGSPSRKEDHKKGGRVKPSSKKDLLKSSAKNDDDGKDIKTSPRSFLELPKEKSSKEDTPRMSTKRKRTPGTDTDTDTDKVRESIVYGKNLIGLKVKVYWPEDEQFYEGVIASFNSGKKKHKVNYFDGEEEELNLRKERWEFLEYSATIFEDSAPKPGGKSKDGGKKEKPNHGEESENETLSNLRSKKVDTAKNKARTPQSGTGMTKPSSSKAKEKEQVKQKPTTSAKSPDVVKGKSLGTAKSGESVSKKRKM